MMLRRAVTWDHPLTPKMGTFNHKQLHPLVEPCLQSVRSQRESEIESARVRVCVIDRNTGYALNRERTFISSCC
jgi:hypothetical protein